MPQYVPSKDGRMDIGRTWHGLSVSGESGVPARFEVKGRGLLFSCIIKGSTSGNMWPLNTCKGFVFSPVTANLCDTVAGLENALSFRISFELSAFNCAFLPMSSTRLSYLTVTFEAPGGRFKNTYELLNLRALKISKLHKNHIFQCMGKVFCVEFQRVPLKFHTKYLTHTLKDVDFIHIWKFKSSLI